MGKRIKERREALGLTIAEFAGKVGATRHVVYLWEEDKSRPREDHMKEILEVLQTTEQYLEVGINW